MTPAPRIVLAGGSGFLGQALTQHFQASGYEVVVLTRSPARVEDGVRFCQWDGCTLGDWAVQLEGATALVNLAGKNVNCRYHAANRRAILQSRLDSVRVLGEAVAACARPPSVWVQAATLAIHGDQGDALLDESSPLGKGFSPDVARQWEAAFEAMPTERTRKVLLRISFVLGRSSGALGTLETLTCFGLGGSVGDGRQYFSWIHVRDLCRLVQWAVDRPSARGMYSATAPEPVTNAQFMAELRRVMRRPWSPPAPRWAVRAGAVLMRTEPELALRSRRCVPRRLLAEGFAFEHPTLNEAMTALYPNVRG